MKNSVTLFFNFYKTLIANKNFMFDDYLSNIVHNNFEIFIDSQLTKMYYH
jgi:hypothetical protein